eukprot:4693608-Amphidinium_carterae.1
MALAQGAACPCECGRPARLAALPTCQEMKNFKKWRVCFSWESQPDHPEHGRCYWQVRGLLDKT